MGAAPQLTPTIESAKHHAKSQAGFEWVLAIQQVLNVHFKRLKAICGRTCDDGFPHKFGERL